MSESPAAVAAASPEVRRLDVPVGGMTCAACSAAVQKALGTAWVQAVLVKVDMDGMQGGSIFWYDARLFDQAATDVAPGPARLAFDLHQNVPNPFNPTTRIDFDLGRKDVIDLSVYDVSGRWIVTLVRGELDSGPHVATWDGQMANGGTAAAGIYRYVLRTSAGQVSRSMVLIK